MLRVNRPRFVWHTYPDADPSTGRFRSVDLTVELNASVPTGWAYLRIPDPGAGQSRLARVVRSDGLEVLLGTNVWTTGRTFIGQSQRPRYENTLHLLDHDSTGRYTLYYAPLPPSDIEAPKSALAALADASYPQFTVNWDGQDGAGSGIASFDIQASLSSAARIRQPAGSLCCVIHKPAWAIAWR